MVDTGSSDPIMCNALLDTASSFSFITKAKVGDILSVMEPNCRGLRVLERDVPLNIKMLNAETSVTADLVRLGLSKGKGGTLIYVNAYVLDQIQAKTNVEPPQVGGRRSIDMLLGVMDVLRIVHGPAVRLENRLYRIPTLLGDAICGTPSKRTHHPPYDSSHPACLATSTEVLTKTLEKMWSIETLPFDDAPSSLTKDEAWAVEKIKEVLVRDPEKGRFTTGLLWRDKPDLINNYHAALLRLQSLLRKLRKDPELKQAYCKTMGEYMELDVVEEVEDEFVTDPSRTDLYFLPHRAVYDAARLSTQCRVVFDASAKTRSKKSLNDNLVCGPALQLQILDIELRFRTSKVVLIGDISKMFLQIQVREEDRDYLRFLWQDPDDPKAPVRVYRWKTLIFGAADSPFQAITAIKQLVTDKLSSPSCSEFDRRVCQILDKNTYVDDLTIVADTVQEAYDLYRGVTDLLGQANFKIKKWATHNAELLAMLDPETVAPLQDTVALHREEYGPVSADISTLGVQWQPHTDRIHFSKCANAAAENRNTKTCVASLLARPFDPLGLISPFILQARVVMKKCHQEKLGWKDNLTPELVKEWIPWVNQLRDLENISFPRHVPVTPQSLIVIFTDASELGYGACVYVCTPEKEGQRCSSHLLCARSRVAPNNRMLSIPQKEMAACLVGAELGQTIHEELNFPKDRMRFFSDSEICLFQLTKPPQVLAPFPANRVEKIQRWGFRFQYVNTKENPADISSRSANLLDLKQPLWQRGPAWLQLPESQWPAPKVDFSIIDKTEGMRKKHIFTYALSVHTPLVHPSKHHKSSTGEKVTRPLSALLRLGDDRKIPFEQYYSLYQEMLRKTAAIFACFRIWRSKLPKQKNILVTKNSEDNRFQITRSDHERALQFWIKQSQSTSFGKEVACLQRQDILPRDTPLLPLDPFLDNEGVLRVGGRLGVSQVNGEQKHPIILPKGHPFVRALVKYMHTENRHMGVDQLHFLIRERYWILQARQLIRSTVRGCLSCARLTARRRHPKMSALPPGRTTLDAKHPCWTFVGVDLTGEIKLKRTGRGLGSPEKGYIVLYTCMSSRAVYLDLITSNTTEDFLMSFKRLCGENGLPQRMFSDQAGYFHRARAELGESFTALNRAMTEASNAYEFSWEMNVQMNPHAAGAWERMIKIVKNALLKVVRDAYLTHIEFLTVLKEVQGLVNDRPLVSMSEDAIDAITPSLLVRGRKMKVFEENFGDCSLKDIQGAQNRWKHRSAVMNQFFRVWSKQYRLSLQQRRKWHTKQPEVKAGDIVVLHQPVVKRGYWPLARVIEVIPGRDNAIRTVKLHLPQYDGKGNSAPPKELIRSVHHTCPLELAG